MSERGPSIDRFPLHRSRCLARAIGVLALALAAAGAASAQRLRTDLAAPSGGGEPPLTGEAGPEAVFEIHRHADLGEQQDLAHEETWSPGWSHVRTYRSQGLPYALLVKGQTGEARVVELDEDGALGTLVGTYDLGKDLTNVEIIRREGQNPRLLLHQRITGRVTVRRITDTGAIGAELTDGIHESLRYKDITRAFQTDQRLFLFSVSRWYGTANVHALDGSGGLPAGSVPVWSTAWNNGWSSAEIYRDGGRTLLVMYKMLSNAQSNSGGQIQVKAISDDGTLQEGTHEIPGDGSWSQGWSHFRVVPKRDPIHVGDGFEVPHGDPLAPSPAGDSGFADSVDEPRTPPPSGAGGHLLLLYKIHDGAFKVLELDGNGVGATVHEGNIGAGWTDLDPFWVGGSLHLAKLNEESRIPFDFEMVKRFRASLQGAYEQNQTKGGGYQVGILQSGRVVFLHAAGWAKRSTRRELRTTDRHGIASVSKTFTTFTLLRLLEQGKLELEDRLLDHLYAPAGPSPQAYPFLPVGKEVDESAEDVRILELLAHSGRFESASTSKALWKGEGRRANKCLAGSLTDDDWYPDPNLRCARGYQNANAGLLGYMIMDMEGVPFDDTEGYSALLDELWMDAAHTDGVFCGGYTDVLHYEECHGKGADCIDGYREFERDAPGSCLSGSLAASTEDLLQFLSVQRYGKVLGPEVQALIFQTEMEDKNGNPAPYHWGQTLLAGEGWMRSKAGGGDGVSAYIAHLPRGIDIAIISNTKPFKGRSGKRDDTPSSPDAVQEAFTAATGIPIVDAQDD
jgi:CubicO group peptidase (beta-lactamase class C family)